MKEKKMSDEKCCLVGIFFCFFLPLFWCLKEKVFQVLFLAFPLFQFFVVCPRIYPYPKRDLFSSKQWLNVKFHFNYCFVSLHFSGFLKELQTVNFLHLDARPKTGLEVAESRIAE